MAIKFSFANKYNTERLFDIDTSGFDYMSLEDLYNEALQSCEGDITAAEQEVFTVHGLYINTKGNFDDAPVAALDECYVNLPAHLCESVREILRDSKAIKAINEGKVGFTIYSYEQRRFNKTCYSIRWVDID